MHGHAEYLSGDDDLGAWPVLLASNQAKAAVIGGAALGTAIGALFPRRAFGALTGAVLGAVAGYAAVAVMAKEGAAAVRTPTPATT